MQACEVCGWDTRSGALVCSACRLERDPGDAGTARADADPNGSSLLRNLLTASDARATGSGTATTVRQLRDGGTDDAGPHVNGRHGTTPAEDGTDDPGDVHGDDADSGPATDDQGSAGVDDTDELAPPVLARTAPADDSATDQDTEAARPDVTDGASPATDDAAAAATDAGVTPDAVPTAVDATPDAEQDGLRAAFRRAGGWTGAAQLALLVLGMLCVFQIVVLIVVNRFLTQAGSAAVTTSEALAAHAKVTGTMFPTLAVIALAVAVFAAARSADDSGRGGIHRRVAGLPSTLWAIVAAATAFLTMGLLDAADTTAQARDVSLRAMAVCAVLGLAAFVAPRGFAVPGSADGADGQASPPTPDAPPAATGASGTGGSPRLLAHAAPETAASNGSAPADDRG
jgi:hypothetical protein